MKHGEGYKSSEGPEQSTFDVLGHWDQIHGVCHIGGLHIEVIIV